MEWSRISEEAVLRQRRAPHLALGALECKVLLKRTAVPKKKRGINMSVSRLSHTRAKERWPDPSRTPPPIQS